MKRKNRNTSTNETQFIKHPAYPFAGSVLWSDLHELLSLEQGMSLSRPFLARILGTATSNVYFRFRICRHKQLLAFMTLLEWLSPAARQAFIQAHCRVCPTLGHRRLVYLKGMQVRASDLLNKSAGLTVITGGTDSLRSFFLTALGHSFVMHSDLPVDGLDIHRPIKLVPVAGVLHLDESLDPHQLRRLVFKAEHRFLTSDSRMVLLNRVLSRVPELLEDLLRLAKHKHVVIADAGEAADWMCRLSQPIDIVTVSVSKRKNEGIRVICQRKKTFSKRQEN